MFECITLERITRMQNTIYICTTIKYVMCQKLMQCFFATQSKPDLRYLFLNVTHALMGFTSQISYSVKLSSILCIQP